ARQWIEQDGFECIELPMIEISRRWRTLLLYLPTLLMNAQRLARIARERNIDLLHNNDIFNLLPVLVKVLSPRMNYVCHVRFQPDGFPKSIFNLWVRLQTASASF